MLVEHPAVLEAAAIGVPDELKGQALVCFCVLRAGHDAGAARSSSELTALVADAARQAAQAGGGPLRAPTCPRRATPR